MIKIKGFTLIELMIVVAIMGILASLLLGGKNVYDNVSINNHDLSSGVYCLNGQTGYYTEYNGKFQLNSGIFVDLNNNDKLVSC